MSIKNIVGRHMILSGLSCDIAVQTHEINESLPTPNVTYCPNQSCDMIVSWMRGGGLKVGSVLHNLCLFAKYAFCVYFICN